MISFGNQGHREGEFLCIASCADGLYMCVTCSAIGFRYSEVCFHPHFMVVCNVIISIVYTLEKQVVRYASYDDRHLEAGCA